MISRFTAGTLSMLAFGVAVIAGMLNGNPAELVLSRALWALVVFAFIGGGVGFVAQLVINEYTETREQAMDARRANLEVVATADEDPSPSANVST